MANHFIIIILSFLSLCFWIISLILLISVKKRLKDGLSIPIDWIIAATCVLIFVRINDVLKKAEIFAIQIPYLHEMLVVLFSLFLLIGIYNLYKKVTKYTKSLLE